MTRIERASDVWKTPILPLYDTRIEPTLGIEPTYLVYRTRPHPLKVLSAFEGEQRFEL